MKKQRGTPLGSKRSELAVAKMRVTLLETGWKRMIARHKEEMIDQQAKIKAAKEAVKALEANEA